MAHIIIVVYSSYRSEVWSAFWISEIQKIYSFLLFSVFTREIRYTIMYNTLILINMRSVHTIYMCVVCAGVCVCVT